MPKYLQKRRRRWYAVMEIPKAQRSIIGKPRFVKSLQTESLTEAERRVLPLIVEWKRLLHSLKSGSSVLDEMRTRAQMAKLEGDFELQMAAEAHRNIAIDAAEEGNNSILDAYNVVHGDWIPIQAHIDDWTTSLNNEKKTVDMKRSTVVRLNETFSYVHEINQRSLRKWVDNILIRDGGLALGTCRRMISDLRSYWTYLNREHDVPIGDTFTDLVPIDASKKRLAESIIGRRQGFSKSDYNKLLKYARLLDESLADLIELAGHTGARIEELCCLKLDNVTDDCLKIEDAKSEAGWREIPIHSNIKELVSTLIDHSTDGYLISGLTFNKYGDRSNAIGKRFGRLKARLGYSRAFVFHSFRKGVATQLEEAGVAENVAARLLGHEIPTMTYGLYSGGPSFEVLKEAVEKLNYNE